MIFASFGNSPVPFVRMAEALEQMARGMEEEVIVQSGYTKFGYKACHNVQFMDKNTFYDHLRKCSVAILQGGWGSISEASGMGVKIIAFPRRKGIEHYHDQIQLVRALDNLGCLIGCYDEKQLPELVEKAQNFTPKQLPKGSAKEVLTEFFESLNNIK